MTMTRSGRSYDRSWDDAPRPTARPGSLPIRAVELAARHPVTSGGAVLSLAMIAVIVGNALINQPQRHPSPWFATRPVEAPARPATPAVQPAAAQQPAVQQPAAAQPAAAPAPSAPTPAVLPRPRPVGAVDDPQTIQQLQVALRDRGLYAGPIDGLLGPATAEAVKAFERRLGVTPTGEPSELLVALARQPAVAASAPAARQAHPGPAHPAPAVQPAAAQPVAHVAPAPLVDRPAPPAQPQRLAVADAVAWAPGADEPQVYADTDAPTTTGSIRRAAREPLAQGGDARLQKIQRALIAAGYGPLKADGRWEEKSIAAVRRWEADHNLTITGKPSDQLVYGLMADGARSRR